MEKNFDASVEMHGEPVKATQKWLLLIVLLLGLTARWGYVWGFKELRSLRELYIPFGIFWGIYLAGFYLDIDREHRSGPLSSFLLFSLLLLYLRGFVYHQAYLFLLNFLAIPLLLMLHMLLSTRRFPKELALYGIPGYLRGWLVYPFASLGSFFKGLSALLGGGRERWGVLIGLCIAVPVLSIVGSLLLRADAAMAYFFSKLISHLAIGSFLGAVLLILIVALLFHSFYISARKGAGEYELKAYPRFLQASTLNTLMILLLFVYLLFLGFQFTYLTGVRGLPAGLSYSEYAVSGFQELCTVAAINLLIFTVALDFTREGKGLCILMALLLFSSLLMVISSGIRLFLYIRAYGLTHARIFSLWFVIFLFLLTILCLIRVWKKGLPLFAGALVLLISCYLCLNLVNLDGIIAKSVLARAEREQHLSEADADYLRYTLSKDAQKVLMNSEWKYAIYYDVDREDLS